MKLKTLSASLFLGIGALGTLSRAQTVIYSDLNANTAGFGTNSSFVWSTNLAQVWTTDASGNSPTTNWPNASPANNAILGTGSGTGSYTATLFNDISVGVISVTNGTWSIASNAKVLTLNTGTDYSLPTVITGTGSVVKTGSGTLTMGLANNYSGGTTINGGAIHLTNANTNLGPIIISVGGQLVLGSSAALPVSTTVTLGGGGLSLSGAYSAALSTPLAISGGSTIDFGSGFGASNIQFADSSGQAWSGNLTISNFVVGSDTIRFGSSSGGLSGSQLAAVDFGGVAAQIDSDGFLTPVPEPLTSALVAGVLALSVAVRKRSRIWLRSTD